MTEESIDAERDRDASVQSAAQAALVDIPKLLTRLTSDDALPSQPARFGRLVERTRALIDIFQEDPQLLDPHLNAFVPPLVARYLALILSDALYRQDDTAARFAAGLCRLISTFCKVRGRKVISTFLDHEPRYLLPVFKALAFLDSPKAQNARQPSVGPPNDYLWEQYYVLLLWLAHLLLTPFDLVTFSPPVGHEVNLDGLTLPANLPSIAVDAIRMSLGSLYSSTNRQVVASTVITRLVLRPDMQKLGLLDRVVAWAISRLTSSEDASSIHRAIGFMMVLNGVLTSGSMHNISQQVPLIFSAISKAFNDDSGSSSVLQASATAKRFAVKIQRGVMTQVLQGRESHDREAARISERMLESASVLEDVVDYLLRSLADRDTQVRMAGSKALATLAKRLDHEMAQDIVEAVIGSLNEDVLTIPAGKSLEAVNPVRWHGLTLTLSHMLFARLPSSDQLQEILDALYLALTFEQKSSSGGSVGGNVRDAANYGLWSLARRYTTKELLARRPSEPNDSRAEVSVLQRAANELVCAACLDPIGNVRRGSSAALQELIGRHPDTIVSGISLVQTVDFQAVGLRGRAMMAVAGDAARLGTAYHQILLEGLFRWRGLLSPDQISIVQAAKSVGNLLASQHPNTIQSSMSNTVAALNSMDVHASENIGALLLALSEIITQYVDGLQNPKVQLAEDSIISSRSKISEAELLETCPRWSFLESSLKRLLPILDFAQRRAGFAAGGYLSLIGAISKGLEYSGRQRTKGDGRPTPELPGMDAVFIKAITCALGAVDEDTFERSKVFSAFSASVNVQQRCQLARGLLSMLDSDNTPSRIPAVSRALAELWTQLRDSQSEAEELRQSIVEVLVRLGSLPETTETRAVAVRSLGTLASLASEDIATINAQVAQDISNVCLAALNDYTINERGDVGSVLRSQALQSLFNTEVHRAAGHDLASKCFLSAVRLYLEKLDKIRLDAFVALASSKSARLLPWQPHSDPGVAYSLADVSRYEHFYAAARFLGADDSAHVSQDTIGAMTTAIIEGFASSAGSGTSTVLPIARAALADVLAALPAFAASSASSTRTNATLSAFVSSLSALLAAHKHTDRTLVPLLEMLAFLLDAQLLQRLATPPEGAPPFKWRTLLAHVQRAHYKTSSMPKLLAVVAVYRGLARVHVLRRDVIDKLAGMLGHPFPNVRGAVAETLWMSTGEDALLERAWTAGVESNRAFVQRLRERVQTGEFDDEA